MNSKLIEENKYIIYSIIKKYLGYYEFDDLWQVAIIGLINAYNNFDGCYDSKFSTYAYMYIFGEVNKYVNSFRPIKLSRDYLHLNKKINETKNLLTQRLMREPTNFEIAQFLEIDENIINEIDTLTKNFDSFDRKINNEEKDLFLYDVIPSNDVNVLDNICLYQELDKLEKDEKDLLMYRYFMDKTQQEVSNCLGINQVQVSRKEKKVLQKIRNNMEIYAKK